MDYQQILNEIVNETRPLIGQGRVADYIPALARVDPQRYGIAIETLKGEHIQVGDAEIPFSIQSISKVLVLAKVLRVLHDRLWERVGREPSGNAFNSLVQLEKENGIPRNPLINAGALVLTDALMALDENPMQGLLDFVRRLSDNPKVHYDSIIANSERECGYRNAALVHFMKSFGNIAHEVDAVLNLYFHQCALMMSCVDLARAFLFLANGGVQPPGGQAVVSPRQSKRINAVMQTCGFYDESGAFAFSVGLPGKSGGGIVAVIPKVMTICVWSPGLNPSGNSLVGMKALEMFTTKTGVSIF